MRRPLRRTCRSTRASEIKSTYAAQTPSDVSTMPPYATHSTTLTSDLPAREGGGALSLGRGSAGSGKGTHAPQRTPARGNASAASSGYVSFVTPCASSDFLRRHA